MGAVEVMETLLDNANCAESNNFASQQYEKKPNPLEFHHARVHIWIRQKSGILGFS